MAAQGNAGSVLSLGGLGVGLGNGHAYAATGGILGVSLGAVLAVAAGTLIVVWLARMVTSDKKKPQTD